MTRQMGLAPQTVYRQMKKFVPESASFRSQPQRPLFLSSEAKAVCPFCGAPKRWIGTVRAIEIDAHRDALKLVKRSLGVIKRKGDAFTIVKDLRTPVQVFSDWLERTSHALHFDGEMWLRDAAIAYLRRSAPTADWTDVENVRRVSLSRRLDEGWEREGNRLYLAPTLYGDVLVIQYLLGRTHLHGALTFEGRLTAFEFFHRLRRLGYLEKRGIDSADPESLLENAIAKLAEEGEIKPYLIIDRGAFLKQLKSVYNKLKIKKTTSK